jgi:hypothetical protein
MQDRFCLMNGQVGGMLTARWQHYAREGGYFGMDFCHQKGEADVGSTIRLAGVLLPGVKDDDGSTRINPGNGRYKTRQMTTADLAPASRARANLWILILPVACFSPRSFGLLW